MKQVITAVFILIAFVIGFFLIIDLRYVPQKQIKEPERKVRTFFWGDSDPNLDPYYDRDSEVNGE